MSTSPRVGIACPRPGERAAVSDWLRSVTIEPVVLVDACFVNTQVEGRPLDCVVADASLLTPHFLMALRRGDPGKAIIALGDAGDPNQEALTRKDVAFHARPIAEKDLLLAVSLGVAEGHPFRRSPRRIVPRLATTIEGEPAVLIDVSNEGLRLELASAKATGGLRCWSLEFSESSAPFCFNGCLRICRRWSQRLTNANGLRRYLARLWLQRSSWRRHSPFVCAISRAAGWAA